MCRRSISEGVSKGGSDTDLSVVLERAGAAGVDRLVCIGTDAYDVGSSGRAWRGVRDGGGGVCAHGLPSVCTRTRRPPVWTAWLHCSRESAPSVMASSWPSASAAWTTTTNTPRVPCSAPRSPRRLRWHMRAISRSVIHARDAWDDLFDVLAAEGVPERTILHCFTGGPEELDRCLRAGMFVSFSGIITFKSASDIREAAGLLPARPLVGGNRQSVPGSGAPSGASQRTIAAALGRGDGGRVKGCAVEAIAREYGCGSSRRLCPSGLKHAVRWVARTPLNWEYADEFLQTVPDLAMEQEITEVVL